MTKQKKHIANPDKQIDGYNNVELVDSGNDYFLRLQKIIANAQNEIHIQTYIFANDSTGIFIADCLKEASSRKVKIYVLLDSYGSSSLSKKFVNDLIKHGINFRFFSPFFSFNNFYIGRRLHHKIIVADGNIALIGGINIADKYQGTKTKTPWLDYAVQIKGPVVEALQGLCKNIYLKKKRHLRRKLNTSFYSANGNSIHILQNDWLKSKNEIFNNYIKSIYSAEKEIIIVGSYFLPGRRLKSALKKASQNGVKIKIILSGISDVPLIKNASCHLYLSLLKENIELYEWNKSILHGKAAVIDKKTTTIGSFNLNHLSSYASIELNVEILSQEFAQLFTTHLNQVIEQSEKITFETLKTRNGIITLLKNWLAYRLVRVALIILTYLPHKRFLKQYSNE